jgi:peptide/nickel transport system substrate-binding protein
MAAIIAVELGRIGVRIHTNPIDFTQLTKRVMTGQYDAVLAGVIGDPEPQSQAYLWRCNGVEHFFHLSCPQEPTAFELQIEELYRQGATTLDADQRLAIYDEAQRRVAEEQPIIHIAVQNVIFAYRTDRLANVDTDPFGNYDVIFRVDLDL